METSNEIEMQNVVQSCLTELDEMEAAFVQDCWLREPKVPLKIFSEKWHLSGKALSELRNRVLERLRNRLVEQGIHSMADLF